MKKMAHELEIIEGKAQMFSGEGLTPWHGLGEVIEGLATAEEALALSGLDFEVELRQLYMPMPDGTYAKVPDRFSTTRSTDNKSLGIVSKGYNVFQNAEAFNFLNAITDTGSGEAVFSTAGSLFGGSRTFMTLKIGDGFTVGDNDAHDLYLMVTNSHDGSQAFTACATPIRAVCNNTVTLGLTQAKTKWTLRHKVSLEGKVHEAREALEMAFKYEDAFALEVEKLMEIEINDQKFHQIVDKIVPASKLQHDKNVDELEEIWRTEPTVLMGGGEGAFGKKNGWAAFNAITFFTDHKEYRTPESKFNSIIGSGVGTGLAEKLRPAAHKAILAFA
jgi:phage/plasmid-like protein (TIGR03299 family)